MKRKIFKAVLWASIEDYCRLIHIIPEVYNEIEENYDDRVVIISKKVLLYYLEEDYVYLFYENWKIQNQYIEIPKDLALKLVVEDSSWEEPKEDIFITVSATQKGEDLYNSGEIMNDNFKLPEIL